jgi:hypothetical protein
MLELRDTAQVQTEVYAGIIGHDVNVMAFGADPTGAIDSTAAFTAAGSSNGSNPIKVVIPQGTYRIDTAPTPTGVVAWVVGTGVTFTGAYGATFYSNLLPYQVTPIVTKNLLSTSVSTSGAGNVFSNASYIKQSGSTPAVAVFGEGDAAGGPTWGSNFVGAASTNVSGSVAMAQELNAVNVAGTTAKTFGLVIAAAGNYPSENFLQVQSNTASAPFKNGIVINSSGINTIQGDIMQTMNSSSVNGINFTSASFSGNAFASPGYSVNGIGQVTAASFSTPSGTPVARIQSVLVLINAPSIPANSTWDFTVSVPSAKIGDNCMASSTLDLNPGIVVSSWCSAAGVVTVRLGNITTAAVDPDGSGGANWRVGIIGY